MSNDDELIDIWTYDGRSWHRDARTPEPLPDPEYREYTGWESHALQVVDLLEQVGRELGIAFGSVSLAGRSAANPFVLQAFLKQQDLLMAVALRAVKAEQALARLSNP